MLAKKINEYLYYEREERNKKTINKPVIAFAQVQITIKTKFNNNNNAKRHETLINYQSAERGKWSTFRIIRFQQ